MKTPYLYCEINPSKITWSLVTFAPAFKTLEIREYPLSSLTHIDDKLFNPHEVIDSFSSFKEIIGKNNLPTLLILSLPALNAYLGERPLFFLHYMLLFSTHIQPPKLLTCSPLLATSQTWNEIYSQRIILFEPPSFAWKKKIIIPSMVLILFLVTLSSITRFLNKKGELLKVHYDEQEKTVSRLITQRHLLKNRELSLQNFLPLEKFSKKSELWHYNPLFLCSLLSSFPPSLGRLTHFELFYDSARTIVFEGIIYSEHSISSFLTYLEKKTGIFYTLESLKHDPETSYFFFKAKGIVPTTLSS